MSLPRVIHSSQRLLSPSSLFSILQGHSTYLVQHNQYLLPFHGHLIHHHQVIIDGRFLHPMWNVLERMLLSKRTVFTHSYLPSSQERGSFLELESSAFVPYHVSTDEKWYKQSACLSRACPPHDSCLLLFAVDATWAEPLIRRHLL